MCHYKSFVAVRTTEKHMAIIGVDQSLSNSAMYEYRCIENINKLYKYAVKCDNQQKYNAIIEAAMASTPEVFTVNIPISHCQYVTVKIQVQ